MQFTKVILFTDTDGRARFREEGVALAEGKPMARLSALMPSSGYQLRSSPVGFRSEFHCTENPQWVFILGGCMQIGLHDGTWRTFERGGHFYSTDTLPAGQAFDPSRHGHRSRQVGPEPLARRIVNGSAAAAAAAPRGVGLYLALVQLLFALGWITYAIYLPELAQQVGLERRWVPWILAADQLIFIVTDLVVGVWSDRAARVQGRIAKVVLAATLVSSLAFLLLPWLAPQGSTVLFIAVTGLWAVTSSALRVPPLTLLGRYVAQLMQPAMVAFTALGLGVANAVQPYVGLALKGIDPRWPFLLSALSLAAVTLGMVAAERALAHQREARQAKAAAAAMPRVTPAALLFLGAVVIVAASFQVHVFLASAPLYRAAGGGEWITHLMPVFWVGFNLALWPSSRWARRSGPPLVLAYGAVLGAFGVALAQAAPNLLVLVLAQLMAGAAWAAMLCSAFIGALRFGDTGREGFFNGSLQALLAVAALSRFLVVVLVAPTPAQLVSWAGAPALAFALAGLLMVAGLARQRGWPGR